MWRNTTGEVLILTPAEAAWLHAYRKLLEMTPEDVAEIRIFGSKARRRLARMPTWTYWRDSRWELASQRGAYLSRIRCCGLTLAVSRRHAPCFTGVRFVQLHWSGMGSLQLQIEHLDEDRKAIAKQM